MPENKAATTGRTGGNGWPRPWEKHKPYPLWLGLHRGIEAMTKFAVDERYESSQYIS